MSKFFAHKAKASNSLYRVFDDITDEQSGAPVRAVIQLETYIR